MKQNVLVIDDEKNFADLLGNEIASMGYQTQVVYRPSEALTICGQQEIDAAVLDMRMPEMDGLETLRALKQLRPSIEVIVLTGHATVDTALQAMKDGAYDYLTKPCKLEELGLLLAKALEKAKVVREHKNLRRFLGEGPPESRLVYESAAISVLLERLDRVAAASDVPVLITGESGTGKELVAREVHRRSPLHDQAFVTINCAALQPAVLESELFGHEKGSFTGATARKIGLFEVARGGALFLDEIGEISEDIQPKLLRALQFGEFRRVGGTEALSAQVRVIAATNRDLKKEIEAGRFREDLYYRLEVVQLHVPPLRERPEDILPLVDHFLAMHGGHTQELPQLDDEARGLLVAHSWPGNVRELENVVRRVLIFHGGQQVGVSDLQQCLGGPTHPGDAPSPTLRMVDVERAHIMKVLTVCDGNKTHAADKLGIALKTLYNKLNGYREQGYEV